MFFNEDKTFYDLLEVTETASSEEILNAYLKLKAAYNKGNNANFSLFPDEERKRFLDKIENAFITLRDQEKRGQYNSSIGLNNSIPTQDPKASEEKIQFIPHVNKPSVIKKESTFSIKNDDQTKKTKNIEVLDIEIKNEQNWSGDFIKKMRNKKNLSLEDLSSYTKISKKYLLAIEEENYAQLPALVYLRGFLIQICKRLDFPEKKVIDAYLGRVKDKKK